MSRFRDCRYEATCRDYALNHCDGCNEWEWAFNKPTQPTVDAVEVVRCKDCIYQAECAFTEWLGRNGNGFCSCGERR
jgi:hypothetical protein